jgi:hypothetical protein
MNLDKEGILQRTQKVNEWMLLSGQMQGRRSKAGFAEEVIGK